MAFGDIGHRRSGQREGRSSCVADGPYAACLFDAQKQRGYLTFRRKLQHARLIEHEGQSERGELVMDDDVQEKQDRHRYEPRKYAPAEQFEEVFLEQHIGKEQKIDGIKIGHRRCIKLAIAARVGKQRRQDKQHCQRNKIKQDNRQRQAANVKQGEDGQRHQHQHVGDIEETQAEIAGQHIALNEEADGEYEYREKDAGNIDCF
ncbi:hypothetical protein AGR1_18270 [Agrobacterium sp. B1(2019)]|nr:hypothetical protein AGR1_18270 [Agrobacterium sp. B1(2019)]